MRWLLSAAFWFPLLGIAFEFTLSLILWVAPEWLAPQSSVPYDSPPVAGDLGTAVVRAVSVGFVISALAPALAYLAVAGTPPERCPTAWVGLGVTILQCLLALIGVVYAPEIARWRLTR